MAAIMLGMLPDIPPLETLGDREPRQEGEEQDGTLGPGLFIGEGRPHGLLLGTRDTDGPDLLSRQCSVESTSSSTCSLILGERGEGGRLPRSLPFVGFLRHAPPQQLLSGQLDRLLRRRAPPARDEADCNLEPEPAGLAPEKRAPPVLPRESPYVGFQRHAPPSPSLCFTAAAAPLPALLKLPEAQLSAGSRTAKPLGVASAFCLEHPEAQRQWPGRLPEEVWTALLAFSVEVPSLGRLSRLSRGFPELLASQAVWAGRPVRVSPAVVPRLARRLDRWLRVWQACSKLTLPRSSQLLAEVHRRAPELQVEVAWRFDHHLKGDGVEVTRHGLTARRISDEELVVLGDSALPSGSGQAPFLEVRLDERGEAIGDGLNDFGFGVTACDPEEIGDLGSVADEVPRSWVVDFTAASVVLSVNNHEAAKGRCVTSDDLRQGDRVGLRLAPGAVEVYINGILRERLAPATEDCVPVSGGLFPVIDLYGRTVQVSRTDAEEPML